MIIYVATKEQNLLRYFRLFQINTGSIVVKTTLFILTIADKNCELLALVLSSKGYFCIHFLQCRHFLTILASTKNTISNRGMLLCRR